MLDVIINGLCDAEESWLRGTSHASVRQINMSSDCVFLFDDDLDDVDSDDQGHQEAEEKGERHIVKVVIP